MKGSIPDKTYFRIGEVSRILDVQPYVIRYWESEFKTVRPIRTRSDQRLYRRRDVEELLMIRKLLYEDKFTISGARKQLHKRSPDTPTAVADEEEELLAEIKKGLRQIKSILG